MTPKPQLTSEELKAFLKWYKTQKPVVGAEFDRLVVYWYKYVRE